MSAAGQTATDNWTGTIPTGSDPKSDCSGLPATQVDEHDISINVPAGTYGTLNATFTFSITWTPGTPTEDTADEILTVLDPSGNEVGSSDGGSTTETVTAPNLGSGTYRVLACGFVNPLPQPYSGKLVVTTSALESSLPSAPAQSLQFSASVPADPQRDESEPLMRTDKAGNVGRSPVLSVFVASIPVAFLSPLAATLMWILAFFVAGRIAARFVQRSS